MPRRPVLCFHVGLTSEDARRQRLTIVICFGIAGESTGGWRYRDLFRQKRPVIYVVAVCLVGLTIVFPAESCVYGQAAIHFNIILKIDCRGSRSKIRKLATHRCQCAAGNKDVAQRNALCCASGASVLRSTLSQQEIRKALKLNGSAVSIVDVDRPRALYLIVSHAHGVAPVVP